jgi:hypothetical protein
MSGFQRESSVSTSVRRCVRFCIRALIDMPKLKFSAPIAVGERINSQTRWGKTRPDVTVVVVIVGAAALVAMSI